MAEVIGVRFKEVGKVYYFDPLDNKLSAGDMVIVETARGLECGKVATPNKTVSDEELAYPLKPLIRIATENDLRHLEENKLKEKEAYRICEQKIANHKLEMKLVSVECRRQSGFQSACKGFGVCIQNKNRVKTDRCA